jgi:hypothetical protein
MSTLIVEFKELKVGDKFVCRGNQFIKVEEFIMKQESCCNFPRNTRVNAQKKDGQYVYFSEEDEVILQL